MMPLESTLGELLQEGMGALSLVFPVSVAQTEAFSLRGCAGFL